MSKLISQTQNLIPLIDTLIETNIVTVNGWKTTFLLGRLPDRCYVDLKDGIFCLSFCTWSLFIIIIPNMMVMMYLSCFSNTLTWTNYSDLSRCHLKWWFSNGICQNPLNSGLGIILICPDWHIPNTTGNWFSTGFPIIISSGPVHGGRWTSSGLHQLSSDTKPWVISSVDRIIPIFLLTI